MLFYNLFESIETLESATKTFVDNCIIGITANPQRCKELLDQNVGTATALCPYNGYKKAAEIAKKALLTGETIKNIVLRDGLFTEDKLKLILNPVAMTEREDSDNKFAI